MDSTLIGHGIRIDGRDYEIVGMTGGDAFIPGGPTVFDAFPTRGYTFMRVQRDRIAGNRITEQVAAEGIFKQRTGMVRGERGELAEQGATLHVKPSESFVTNAPANREHLTLTLQPTSYSDYEVVSAD